MTKPEATSRAANSEVVPAGDERHLLGAANGRAVAGSARALRPVHDGLQSLESLAQGWHLGSPDGCGDEGARWSSADDRQLDRARSSAPLGSKRVEIVV